MFVKVFGVLGVGKYEGFEFLLEKNFWEFSESYGFFFLGKI